MAHRRKRQSGFTLVEVLVATAVLAIALLAALTAFSMAARVAGVSTCDTVVTFLAQQKLAEVRLSEWGRPTPGTTTGSFAPAYSDYSWELTVHRSDPNHLSRVDLVIYAPGAGEARAYRFTTAVH